MKITDDELKALRAKHPRGVIVLSVEPEDAPEPDGDGVRQFAFRKIDRVTYARYRAETKHGVASGGGTGEEEAQLARSLLVHPDVAAFDQLREDAPGIAAQFGQELLTDASAGLLVARDPR